MKNIIEAPSEYHLHKKVEEMNKDAYDKWAEGGYKGEHPRDMEVKQVVSTVANAGVARARIGEHTWCCEDPEPPMPGKSGIRHPLGPFGGGI